MFDIETSPNLAYTWGKWEQNVIAFKKEWEMLSVSWKWLDSKRVYCATRKTFKSEKQLIQILWQLFDKAEMIIAHNGDQFDIKKTKAKFLEHGMKPTSPYRQIDTKKIAKSQFNFNSNSLDDLGRTLGVGRKEKTGGFDLWLECMEGKKSAWDKMAKYNKQDVLLLEKVYLKMRAWSPNHPDVSKMKGATGCPSCGSVDIIRRGVDFANPKKPRMSCNSCGKWFFKK